MKQYFTTKFLFFINSVSLEKADKVFFAAGIVMVLLAILFKLSALFSPTPVDRKYRGKLFRLFATIGIAEVVWFGARWQNVRFFGTHFLALLILLIGLIWLGYVLKDIIKHYSADKSAFEKEQVKLKYLPR